MVVKPDSELIQDFGSESGFTAGGQSMMSEGSNQSFACSVSQEDIKHRAGVVWKRPVLPAKVLQCIFFPIFGPN